MDQELDSTFGAQNSYELLDTFISWAVNSGIKVKGMEE